MFFSFSTLLCLSHKNDDGKKFSCYQRLKWVERGFLSSPFLIHDGLKAIIEIFINNLFPFSLFRLKLECEKLASEKTEMQRHYVMVSEVLKKERKRVFLLIEVLNEF